MRATIPFKRSLGAVSHAWLACSLLGAAACILAGCNGEEAAGATQDTGIQESSLVATWSMTQNSPVGTVIVTMEVNADHTMLVSVKAPTGTGTDMAETQREKMTWSVASGNMMSSAKTLCHYSDGAGGLTEQACKVPTSETVPVAVSGKNLTVVRGELSYVFTKP